MYNILYDRGDGTQSLYLKSNVCHREAETWLEYFVLKYVGKAYPNGKGCYPFHNPRIVDMTPCHIVATRTNRVLHKLPYWEAVEHIRCHWDAFESGDIELVYASNGRYASFVFKD